MSHLSVKSWIHGIHMPKKHGVAMSMAHLVHNDRFWALVALAVLIGLVLTVALLTGYREGTGPEMVPMYPFYPIR